MGIGISDEHEALAATVGRWAESHCPPAVPRALLDADDDAVPELWRALGDQGWAALHLPVDVGGHGYGIAELVVVLEALGRAACPGPLLPTALALAVLQEGGASGLVEEVVRTGATGAVALGPGPVLGASQADVVVLPIEDRWYAVDAGELTVVPRRSIDLTRRVADVRFEGVRPPADRALDGITTSRVRDLAAVLAGAEAVGGAVWCLETAAAYAKVREQFGRPIGQFQAVKHRVADMLTTVEQARAAAWDAALVAGDAYEARLPAAVAAVLALEGFFGCAKDCIQVLGGIGFTWEHDAHIYLRRAIALRQLLGGPAVWRRRAAELAVEGVRRTLRLALPEETEPQRAAVRRFLAGLDGLDRPAKRARMAEEGYLAPHWPAPWGRDASPAEQLIIDEEFVAARVRRPHLQVGAWALPTIIGHGTVEQQERWVPSTLRGETSWCQLFSEPGAGSDLASLATKASRTDGGWLLSGQKVWTTLAHEADFGICLARTNPDAPKHAGITYFIVDMRADGIDVRPLRELTGFAMFNEVFLNDVFVPDDCVIGEVDDGWRLARTTLANERVSMAEGSSFGAGLEGLVALVAAQAAGDPLALDTLGGLVAEAHALSVLGYRTAVRALVGTEPGPEASVRKLVSVEHDQRVQEAGLTLLGAQGAAADGDAQEWAFGFLANRCLTIAGGTSEVQRNVIAERLLGLPRDP